MNSSSEDKTSIEAIDRLVTRVRRRVNIQLGLERATTAAIVAVLLAMVALALWKTGWIPAAEFGWTAGGLVLLPLAAFGSPWLRERDPVALAQRIDHSHQLHDRLSTALSLARGETDLDPRDGFTDAQLREAVTHTDEVDPSRAVPFHKPRDLAVFGACLAAFGGVALFQPPSHAEPLPDPPVIKHEPVLDAATLAVEKERVEQMRQKLEGSDDPQAEQLVDEIDELLEQVEEREISGKEFLKRLEEIEKQHLDDSNVKQFEKSIGKEFEKAAEKLRKQASKAGGKLEDRKAFQEAAEALENQEGEKASKALEKLAEKLASQENLDDETVGKLAEMLEKFSDEMKGNREQLEKLLEKNEQLVDKLSEKLDRQGNLSQRNQRRLDRAQDNLDKLRNQQDGGEKQDENKRNLERLQRESEDAAQKLRNAANQKGGAEGKEEQRDETDYQNRSGRQADSKQRRKQGGQKQRRRGGQKRGGQSGEQGQSEEVEQMARKQLEELRESMRRSRPQRSRSQRSDSSNSDSRSGDNGEKMREYLRRAQGESKNNDSSGKPRGQRAKKGNGQKKGEGKSKGPKSGKPGNSAGDQPGGKGPGDKTAMKSKRKDSKVSGRKGRGASRSQVIRTASEKGFATREYKDVYGDYSPVVEEVMEREDVPPGYRYYVKRYFELIKPRD